MLLVCFLIVGCTKSSPTLVPESCSFPVGSVTCTDYAVRDGEIRIFMVSAGQIVVKEVSATSQALGKGGGSCSTEPISEGMSGGSKEFVLKVGDCSYRDTGIKKNTYELTIKYVAASEPASERKISGTLVAMLQNTVTIKQ